MNAYTIRLMTGPMNHREEVWTMLAASAKGARSAILKSAAGGRVLAVTRAEAAPRRLGP